MSELLLHRIDTGKLYPPFLFALRSLLDDAFNVGASFWCVSGYRSYAEQTVLYDQGRTTAGPKVTMAPAGFSPHNFGIAADLCRDGNMQRAELQPDWKREDYEILRTLAPAHGLLWGGTFQSFDGPHVQLPNYVTGQQLDPLRYCYELAGLTSVFEFLSKGAATT